MTALFDSVITVTLNPAIDCVFETPHLRIGEHQVGRRRFRIAAGKGVNVARSLALLGHRCVATGFVGRAELSLYDDSLAAYKVSSQFLAVDGRTRENITLIDPTQGVETHIRDTGFQVGAADIARMSRKLGLLARERSLVCFCGSTPPGMSVEGLGQMVDLCISRGAAVAADADGPVLRQLTARRLWAIKPNRQEFEAIVGQPVPSDDELVRFGRELARDIPVVLVSCGVSGAYGFTADITLLGQVDVDTKDAVSTVGCGDSLLAGFLAGKLEGLDDREAFRKALAVATAATLHPEPGVFDPGAVAAFLPRTAVETVK